MNEQTDKPTSDATVSSDPGPPSAETRWVTRKYVLLVSVAAMAMVALVVVGLIFFWPRQGGKPVPAPRTVSFAETRPAPNPNDQRLVVTPEQLRTVQLKIETVGEQPSSEAAGQLATGVVQANTYKETPVVALVGGIVRTVNAELGQNVKRGQGVAVVFSNDLADTQSKYLAAVASLDEHHRHHMRTIKLVEIGAASRQELEMAVSQYREAESNLANLRQKLMLFGMTPQRIDELNSTSQISSEVQVTSPSNGTITNRSVNPGEVIEANKELLRVTDLSTVWVVGQVYEKDLATVRIGSGANITSDAYPNRVFRGRVSYVDPKIDPATRTAQVRIELANPKQMFKIGMYVNVAFGMLGAAEKTMPVVPKDAVQTIGNQQFVFLATDQPTEFILRAIRVGAESNGSYPVFEGLHVGDRVVVDGSFLLRAEWMRTHPVH